MRKRFFLTPIHFNNINMFRWVSLQLDEFGKLNSKEAMNNALHNLPSGLDETYARSLAGVPEGHREDAILLLQLLLFSNRPLSVEEVLHALTVDPGGPPGSCIRSDRLMPSMRSLSTLISSLVKESERLRRKYHGFRRHGLNRENPITTLQIAHSSVRDYLCSDLLESALQSKFTELGARKTLVGVCLAYFGTIMVTIPDYGTKVRAPLFWILHERVAGSCSSQRSRRSRPPPHHEIFGLEWVQISIKDVL